MARRKDLKRGLDIGRLVGLEVEGTARLRNVCLCVCLQMLRGRILVIVQLRIAIKVWCRAFRVRSFTDEDGILGSRPDRHRLAVAGDDMCQWLSRRVEA